VGTSIKLVSSNDGGLTWGSPVSVVGEFCNDPTLPVEGAVEFSGVAVDPAGTTVYVSWEFIDVANYLTTFAREVDIAKASIPTSPSPLSFGSPVKVSGVNFAGAFDTLSFGSGGGFTFFQGLQAESKHSNILFWRSARVQKTPEFSISRGMMEIMRCLTYLRTSFPPRYQHIILPTFC
jgi:hypothetical protein